ncbi:hypothetical protein NDU88_001450, partial [Pleurodeles waltl]
QKRLVMFLGVKLLDFSGVSAKNWAYLLGHVTHMGPSEFEKKVFKSELLVVVYSARRSLAFGEIF